MEDGYRKREREPQKTRRRVSNGESNHKDKHRDDDYVRGKVAPITIYASGLGVEAGRNIESGGVRLLKFNPYRLDSTASYTV